ncbi:fluoride efflux transporter FluC [Desulfuribacillus alkaliarsenatis]|uniref:Fluoride-specific ion channel FluC n=1 Tax=Desulfuribacillus alkaliarsenatis TaxID=766136 RepID=A0A1E5G5W1_9FIRM|nr:CrcB family protein [Desulfuribacillus alkaliarsenatis]OEF98578.1 hypothetical protein BHF68_02640 [Desulfuribacillus alkaliarsenatis]
MKNSLFVALGGALGTLFRYIFNHLEYFTVFPYWTIAENVIGSFLLATLTGYVITKKVPLHWRNGLGPGLCGSFTTMSTFAYDSVFVAEYFSIYFASLYISVSLLFGITAAFAGLSLGKHIACQRNKEVDSV